MAVILKKVWESVMNRSGPDSRAGSSDQTANRPASAGPFDQLPTEVFIQIFRLLGPRDTARASAVCRAWRELVSDNMLWEFFLQNGREPWETVIFSETYLSSGRPYT